MDFYKQKAMEYFNVKEEDVTLEMRKVMKDYYFSENYGLGTKELKPILDNIKSS